MHEWLLGGNTEFATVRESHVCQGDAGPEPQPYRSSNASPDEGAFGSTNTCALRVPYCDSICGTNKRTHRDANAGPDGGALAASDFSIYVRPHCYKNESKNQKRRHP